MNIGYNDLNLHMEEVHVKFASSQDFDVVRHFDPHSIYIDPEKLKYKLMQKEVLIAQFKDKIVGIIKFSYFWSTRPYLDLIYVEERIRKQGIGTKLLQFLEIYLVKAGYNYLYTSAQGNEPDSQNWHKRQGFRECGKLEAINLPRETNTEVFYFKRIANGDPNEDTLKTYPVS